MIRYWLKFMFGVVGVLGFFHIISRQLWVNHLYDQAISLGTTPSQVTLIDSSFSMFLFIAVVAGVIGVFAYNRRGEGGYVEVQ